MSVNAVDRVVNIALIVDFAISGSGGICDLIRFAGVSKNWRDAVQQFSVAAWRRVAANKQLPFTFFRALILGGASSSEPAPAASAAASAASASSAVVSVSTGIGDAAWVFVLLVSAGFDINSPSAPSPSQPGSGRCESGEERSFDAREERGLGAIAFAAANGKFETAQALYTLLGAGVRDVDVLLLLERYPQMLERLLASRIKLTAMRYKITTSASLEKLSSGIPPSAAAASLGPGVMTFFPIERAMELGSWPIALQLLEQPAWTKLCRLHDLLARTVMLAMRKTSSSQSSAAAAAAKADSDESDTGPKSDGVLREYDLYADVIDQIVHLTATRGASVFTMIPDGAPNIDATVLGLCILMRQWRLARLLLPFYEKACAYESQRPDSPHFDISPTLKFPRTKRAGSHALTFPHFRSGSLALSPLMLAKMQQLPADVVEWCKAHGERFVDLATMKIVD